MRSAHRRPRVCGFIVVAVVYFTALKGQLRKGGRLAIIDFRKDSPNGPPAAFRFAPVRAASPVLVQK